MEVVYLCQQAKLTSVDESSGLCVVCQQLDFIARSNDFCRCEVDTRIFHVGSLQHVVSKTFCPSCRLIASALAKICRSGIGEVRGRIFVREIGHFAFSSRADGHTDEPKRIAEANGIENIETEYEVHPVTALGNVIEILLEPDDLDPRVRVTGAIIREHSPDQYGVLQLEPTGFDSEVGVEKVGIRARAMLPFVDLSLIKAWISFCDSQHNTCCKSGLSFSEAYPIRLIDVQQRKIVCTSELERYMALSYMWGLATLPMLTRATAQDYSLPNSLQQSMVPKTIFDAIQLVNDIGERYLWVDSLCIVQDDPKDKRSQLAIMGDIYRGASLVVIAAAGTDAHAGIPGIGDTERRPWQMRETINGVDFITAQPTVRQALEQTQWNNRGWTFQELTLATRILVFTEETMYFNCRVDSWREDISFVSPTTSLLLDESTSVWYPLPETGTCRSRMYCEYISKFSGRRFKEEGDVLWAFSSILKLQESWFPQGFIWGLPYEDLDSTLLWRENPFCAVVHTRHAQHCDFEQGSPLRLPYPSWSWLSTRSNVSFKDMCGDSTLSDVTWHRPIKSRYLSRTCGQENLRGHTDTGEQAAVFEGLSICGKSVAEYGFLHFTAQATELDMRLVQTSNTNDDSRIRWALASIRLSSGEEIGQLIVPTVFFGKNTERLGQVILLSSNAERKSDENCVRRVDPKRGNQHIIHKKPCKHVRSHNIMLIEWVGIVAIRRGLTVIKTDDWAKVATQAKRIILG